MSVYCVNNIMWHICRAACACMFVRACGAVATRAHVRVWARDHNAPAAAAALAAADRPSGSQSLYLSRSYSIVHCHESDTHVYLHHMNNEYVCWSIITIMNTRLIICAVRWTVCVSVSMWRDNIRSTAGPDATFCGRASCLVYVSIMHVRANTSAVD